MEIKISAQGKAPVRLVTCFEGHQPTKLDANLTQAIGDMLDNDEFTPKFGTTQVITPGRRDNPRHIILMGLGKTEDLTLERVRRIAGKAVKQAQKLKAAELDIELAEFGDSLDTADLSQAIGEGAMMATYKFDKFISDRKENPLKEVHLIHSGNDAAQGLGQGLVLAEATNLARRLVDEPANIMTPARLADEAEAAGKKYGFEVKVRDEAGIRALGMEAFLMVGRASENCPRLIVMHHRGDPDSEEVLALVGKGLTYDSGGLSIKPTAGMAGMKGDMSGAAAVVGAMAAISKLNVKANVVGVIAACENMISGKGYKPGDIIGSMAGKSIEVLNTDAEGRLTLADAVHYAIDKEKATRVLDIATLTGAAIVTLGNVATAVLATDEIGRPEDVAALAEVFNAGVSVLTTVHGSSLDELAARPVLSSLFQTRMIERLVLLGRSAGPGTLEKIIDGKTLGPLEVRT
jgi:leucyl aminopeptidase